MNQALIAGALALAIGFGCGWAINGWRLESDYEAEKAERAKAENIAILQRIKNNERAVEQNAIDNQRITKEKNDAIDKVRADIARSSWVRGSAICGGSADSTEAKSTVGGDGKNTGGGLVREDVRRDIDALKMRVEEALAAGRACQEFVKSKGMAP